MSFSLLRQASPCSMAVRSLRRRPQGHRTSAPRSRSAVARLTTVLWTSSWRCSGRLLRRGRLRTKPWRFCGSGLTNPVTRRPGRQRLLVKLGDRLCAQMLRRIAWRSGVRRPQLFAQRIDVRGSVLFLGLLAESSCACEDRIHEQCVITCTFVYVSLRVFQFVTNVPGSVCFSAVCVYSAIFLRCRSRPVSCGVVVEIPQSPAGSEQRRHRPIITFGGRVTGATVSEDISACACAGGSPCLLSRLFEPMGFLIRIC